MINPTNHAGTHTEGLLCSLPTRTPQEVRDALLQIVTETGGSTQDDGERYWLMSWCHVLTIAGWPTPDDAAWAANYLRETKRYAACRQWHAVLDMTTLTYMGESLFSAVCRALLPSLDVLSHGPWVMRIPTDRFRHVLVPGLPLEQQPWLVFRAKPDEWFVGWGTGDYPDEPRLRQLFTDSGIDALIRWLFYEVQSQPQWSRAPMKLWSHEIWEHCPRPIAIKLVPALRTLLTDLILQIDSEQRGVPALV